ncbi:LytS/YhcK type 5TM receptor domain-containing protein [Clostridium sp.]
MLYDVIMSVCMNISLLIVLAMILTKFQFVKELLFNEEYMDEEREPGQKCVGGKKVKTEIPRHWSIGWNQFLLGLIFAVFCIISDYIGIQVEGAIPNARVIGVLSAGFLGGPIAGMTTAVLAAIHRYVILPERISTVACVISALVHGVMASIIGYRHKERKEYSNRFLLLTTFAAEAFHMGLILVMTRPFWQAVEIVKIVLVPMVIINSFGMVIFFSVFKSIFNQADLEAAANVSLALRTAERCIPYLADAETNPESMDQILKIILSEYGCVGAAIIREYTFLGRSRAFQSITLDKSTYPRLLSATKTYRTTRISRVPLPEDAFYPLYKNNVIISAPIVRDEETVLCLVMLMRKNAYSYRSDIEFAGGLASYFATQLKLAEMEKQKEHLRKAEIKALQSQINPHFLFNALNTISCFCREKPEKARELLMALSSYFRNMLEDMDEMVTLETELDHVRAYVMLEEARFEEHLSVTIEAEPEDCTCRVPNLILQPIVENAIRHGAVTRDKGVVKIEVHREEKNTVIDISDNGTGMEKSVIDRLYEMDEDEIPKQEEGHGIGMLNVQRRLVSLFGKEAGLQILSSERGTLVRFLIPNARRTEETE